MVAHRTQDPGEEPQKASGIRHNGGKPPISMVMEGRRAVEGCARVLGAAAATGKYDRSNWRLGLKITECADSLLRHLTAFLSGEDVCPDSGLPHVDHISCNALFLAETFHTRPSMDDRPKIVYDR